MADASDSKSDAGNSVWVQVPSPAVGKSYRCGNSFFYRIGKFFLYDKNALQKLHCGGKENDTSYPQQAENTQ